MQLAKYDDINKLALIRVEQQQDDWGNEFTDNDDLYNRTKQYLEKHLNNDLYIFIEKDKENIIATCGLQIIKYLPQCNDNGKTGYICNVFTKSDYRNSGIQTKLLKECIEFAKGKNICELQLSSDSPKAISIYEKQGFIKDDLIMKLEL